MTKNVTTIKIVTFNEGTHIYSRAVMTVTAGGILITGKHHDTMLEQSRYFPKVKIKECHINGVKQEKHNIKEDDSL
jgi:hypothetical protein